MNWESKKREKLRRKNRYGSESAPPETTGGTLGTFSGVFTPNILTILGIILFLRLGYVIGNAGLGRALIIIALANAISVLTSVSLSAIATNLKVKDAARAAEELGAPLPKQEEPGESPDEDNRNSSPQDTEDTEYY